MAQSVDNLCSITLTISLPWWWKGYVYALKFFSNMGVLSVNKGAAAEFIVRHTKFYMLLGHGRRKRL